MSIYLLLKNYRNLENHKIKGIIQNFETVEYERFLILNFYEKTDYAHMNLNFQYCPIYQESLYFDDLLTEKFFEIPSKKEFRLLKRKNPSYKFLSKRKIFQNQLVNKILYLPLNNFIVNFEKDLWKNYIFENILEMYLKIYKKFFNFSRNKKLKSFILKKKILFYNFIIKQEIFKNNMLKFQRPVQFYKKWFQILFKLNLLQIYFLKTEKLSLMYAEEVLDFPIQLIFRVSKKFELKKLYLKHFFFKKMVVKMPQHIWYLTILKNFKRNLKKRKSFKFKFQKVILFNKLIRFVFFKLSLIKLKFKFKKTWKIFLRLNLKTFLKDN
jgi:hypothetical protein